MSYNILGINSSHNGSVCVLRDGEIDFFVEEERFSRNKHEERPVEILEYVASKYKIDEIAVGGLEVLFQLNTGKIYQNYLKLLFKKAPLINLLKSHHLCHAFSSFSSSGFDKALCVVIDGAGSLLYKKENDKLIGVETESVFTFEYPANVEIIYKSYKTFHPNDDESTDSKLMSSNITLGKLYEGITTKLFGNWVYAGKTMGLSSYGKYNSNIPPLIINQRANPEFLAGNTTTNMEKDILQGEARSMVDGGINEKYNYLFEEELRPDISYHLQNEIQEVVGDIIEKYIKKTGLKQVCCSGGYFLNCVSNYYLKKRFPDVDFYFDPTSNDAGIALGAAKLLWHIRKNDTTIRPQKTLYNGPKYTNKEINKKINEYLD